MSTITPSSGNGNGNSAVTSAQGTDLSLEEIIVRANRIGMDYVERRREAERLELLRPSIRSLVMNRIEAAATERLSENKLRRLAEADEEYLDHLERIAEARAESEKLRIRYESYRNLFDARRTLISYRKAELRALGS
jgi:hypothetical protein